MHIGFRALIYMATGVSIAAHCMLYLTLVRIFGITRPRRRILLGALLAFASVSFILSRWASRIDDNVLTRGFYLLGNLWMGVFLHLIIAAAAVWLAVLAARVSGRSIKVPVVTAFLFAAASAYSAYGVYNAFNPQVRDVRVALSGLPDVWKGRTIVQVSDVHLGFIYRADFLEKIVGMVNRLKPDMVVITGDLFDGSDGELSELAAPIRKLFAPYGVYFVTGNHERHLGVEGINSILARNGVRVLDDELVELDGLQLAGIGYRGRNEDKVPGAMLGSLPGYVPDRPTVLLYHSPVHTEEARTVGVSLQLSGHTHKGQLFPFGYITNRIYDGLDYGLHRFGEYSIYVTNGAGTWGPPMRTGNTPEIARITLE